MRILGIILTTAIMFAGYVSANDTAEMADLQARIATLEARLMAPSGGGDAESLTSLRKKGAVKIGGDIEIEYLTTRRTEANESSDQINRNRYNSGDADLNIRVDAGTDTYLFIKLDLDDSGNDGDLTEELQFVWENVRGSNWKLIFGKDEVPYGQDKNYSITDPYVHGSGSIMTVAGGEPAQDAHARFNQVAGNRDGSEEDFHESQVIMANWVGERDNRWGITAAYKFKSLGSFEICAFQDRNDMHEDRSEDHGFQSWATRFKLKPLEGLKLSASFINVHQDSLDSRNEHLADGNGNLGGTGINTLADRNLDRIVADRRAKGLLTAANLAKFNANGPKVDDDEMGASFGFIYNTINEKLEIAGEWSHTWNAGHYSDLSADVISLGAIYGLTPKLDLIAMGDMAFMDNDVFNALGIDFEEHIYHAGTALQYTCDNGIKFKVQYSHEWYRNNLQGWDNGEGDFWGFETKYSF